MDFRVNCTYVLISNFLKKNRNFQRFLQLHSSISSDKHALYVLHCNSFVALTRTWNCPWIDSNWGADLIININSVLIGSVNDVFVKDFVNINFVHFIHSMLTCSFENVINILIKEITTISMMSEFCCNFLTNCRSKECTFS